MTFSHSDWLFVNSSLLSQGLLGERSWEEIGYCPRQGPPFKCPHTAYSGVRHQRVYSHLKLENIVMGTFWWLPTAHSWHYSNVAAVSRRPSAGRFADLKCGHHPALPAYLCHDWQDKGCRSSGWPSPGKAVCWWGMCFWCGELLQSHAVLPPLCVR